MGPYARKFPTNFQTPEEIHQWFNRTEVGEREQWVYDLARKYFPGGSQIPLYHVSGTSKEQIPGRKKYSW